MFVNIIVAYNKNYGIGINNSLPWKITSDLKKFKNLTIGNKKNAIIMGKNTWKSLNEIGLPHRDNLILSTSLILENNHDNNITKTFKNEIELYNFIEKKNYEEIWVIGGENIYDLFLNKTNIFKVKNIYITLIDNDFECDSFFPAIDTKLYSFISKSIHLNNKVNYVKFINNENVKIILHVNEFGNDIIPSFILYKYLRNKISFENIYKFHTKSDNIWRNDLTNFLLDYNFEDFEKIQSHPKYKMKFKHDIYNINYIKKCINEIDAEFNIINDETNTFKTIVDELEET